MGRLSLAASNSARTASERAPCCCDETAYSVRRCDNATAEDRPPLHLRRCTHSQSRAVGGDGTRQHRQPSTLTAQLAAVPLACKDRWRSSSRFTALRHRLSTVAPAWRGRETSRGARPISAPAGPALPCRPPGTGKTGQPHRGLPSTLYLVAPLTSRSRCDPCVRPFPCPPSFLPKCLFTRFDNTRTYTRFVSSACPLASTVCLPHPRCLLYAPGAPPSQDLH
jgi:hypothetical protein